MCISFEESITVIIYHKNIYILCSIHFDNLNSVVESILLLNIDYLLSYISNIKLRNQDHIPELPIHLIFYGIILFLQMLHHQMMRMYLV